MNNKEEKKPILISACLLGLSCKYNGGDNKMEGLGELMECYQLIPVCPEQLGGLMTPRTPAEICGGRVVTRDGTDVTAQYERGAQEALYAAKLYGCRCAILKAKSPSCGRDQIYDGTFSKTLTAGDGKTAALLKKNGIRIYTEMDYAELFTF